MKSELRLLSPYVRESKAFLDCGSGFQVLDPDFFCQWNLDTEFQSFAGFRIP